MRRNKKCDCNRGVTKFKHVKLKIIGSVVELKCTKCKNLIGWWYIQAEKIMPIKRIWSKKESLAMR
jgi:hypothetical protein